MDNYAGTGYTLAEIEAFPMVQADALLAMIVARSRARIAAAQDDLRSAESLLIERMAERGATIADGGPVEIRLEMTRSYDYDHERLANLQQWLSVDDYEKAVRWEQPPAFLKVDKRALNALEKRGGEIAATIRGAVTEKIGARKITLVIRAVDGGAR